MQLAFLKSSGNHGRRKASGFVPVEAAGDPPLRLAEDHAV